MPKLNMHPIPGNPEEAKQKLYGLLKEDVKFKALSPEALQIRLEFLENYWNQLGEMVISGNTIDVQLYVGQDITATCHALFHLAQDTGRVVTSSFNNVKSSWSIEETTMANISIRLSEEEVNKIILDTIRDKFRIGTKTELIITWTEDSGALISTPETSLDKSTSWLDGD